MELKHTEWLQNKQTGNLPLKVQKWCNIRIFTVIYLEKAKRRKADAEEEEVEATQPLEEQAGPSQKAEEEAGPSQKAEADSDSDSDDSSDDEK